MKGLGALPSRSEAKRVLSVRIQTEVDIVSARQRTRQIAAILKLPHQDQVSLATAVSEIARNAYQYGGGGSAEFEVDLTASPQVFWIRVIDSGPGITNLEAILGGRYTSSTGMGIGLIGSKRLTDHFAVQSSPKGTQVHLGKNLPESRGRLDIADLAELSASLANEPVGGVADAFRQQNHELLSALDALRSREADLVAKKIDLERLNGELAETNRGVVALYGELEERADALRKANEIKTQFLSHVSHEYRTPVNSIMALTHLLLRRTDGELTVEQEKQVSFIRQAAEGLAEMVNDLLDLARVESGKTEIRATTVEVSKVFGAVRALMRPLATNEAVSLIFEEPTSEMVIETDELKLGQILRNLVSNALKFTERGEVRASVGWSEMGNQLVFSVADTGIGIAPDHIDVVFEEFAQIPNSIQGKVKGTGLGLSLSRKLARLLGGDLEVTSQVGTGSVFKLRLPAKNPASSRVPMGSMDRDLSPTILIIDDEAMSRYVARQMFRGTSYRLIEGTGLEAAEIARFERPDLIILDLMMPGRTGFEIVDELKSDSALSDVPIVIHTSKQITAADLHRLKGRHLTILAKGGGNRAEAFQAIRRALGDATLFESEPEFSDGGN